jgi:hypothetical protein
MVDHCLTVITDLTIIDPRNIKKRDAGGSDVFAVSDVIRAV